MNAKVLGDDIIKARVKYEQPCVTEELNPPHRFGKYILNLLQDFGKGRKKGDAAFLFCFWIGIGVRPHTRFKEK